MEKISSGYEDMKNICGKLISNNIEKLDSYKNERKKLPSDSDGIFIIV